jgi:hypothetical protein
VGSTGTGVNLCDGGGEWVVLGLVSTFVMVEVSG